MARETVILSWNFTNWITVVLMVVLFGVVARTVHKLVMKRLDPTAAV